MWEQLKQKDGCETSGGRAIISWARMNFREEGGRALAGGLDSAPWKNTCPACCEMAPQRRPFEPELIDSLCHNADELLNFSTLSLALHEEDDGKRAGPVTTEPDNTSASEAARKKAVIYFDVTRIKPVHVTHCRGTLIMLSEEDGRMLSPSAETARHTGIKPMCACLSPATQILCPLFFLTDSWEKENGRARGVESPSEKKANREHKQARLKHSQCECHQRAGDSCTSYNDGAAYATMLRWNLLF